MGNTQHWMLEHERSPHFESGCGPMMLLLHSEWTVARLQSVLKKREQIVVSRDTIWRRLRESGLTYQKTTRVYREADEETRNEWLRTFVPRIRKTVRKYKAILYFQDEANVSLTAFLGKTWAPSGQSVSLFDWSDCKDIVFKTGFDRVFLKDSFESQIIELLVEKP